MSIRVEAAARTRAALVDAGLRLAGQFSLAELSVNRIVAEAGVSKGTFFHHFPNRVQYLVALHKGFHDRLDTEMAAAVGDLPPGRERLRAAQRAYLDGCLHNRGVRALLLEARAERAITDQIGARNKTLAHVAAEDFRAMGWSHPIESARLWIGLVVEAALLELDEAAASPAIRAALEQYLTAT
ncbi:TetR/AcrR family transcriptional regulator [Nocardia sp. NBC_00565]|uniref:TetR/AcrR family transcriptional regulator n=1 Tax=Nocardia sp. NBC_00565 TaxID=2975993 RepID=UPI002E81CD2D|nr:TetR/AcrR family transcriptional regulator [Nocardia sp. NBC_00565]WUC00261.1 TetR/AcrR family transcriptional regulator [Nocardia sp. NBC_00565]